MPAYAPTDIGKLRRIYEQLVSDRSNAESQWDQIEKFCCPGVGGRAEGSSGQEGEVAWKRDEVWDFTAITGLLKLAAAIHGSLTSPAIRWFRLAASDKRLLKDQEVARFLEYLGDTVFDTIQDSDFNAEISRLYLELVAFGNGYIVAEARQERGAFAGLDFTCVPVREGFNTLTSRGRVNHFFRKIQWTPCQLVERFGRELVPARVAELADGPQGNERKMEVIFAVFPRGDSPEEYQGEAAKTERPWGACYFLLEGDGDDCLLGEEDGYYEHPVFRAIWAAQAGSDLGRGLGIVVLPTVKLINAICEAKLNALEKVVDPSLITTQRGLLADPNLTPGGITVVQAMDQIQVMPSGANFDVAAQEVNELRAMVRKVLHEDELTMKDSPAMTATEAQIRFELMNRLLGATLSLLTTDVLDLIIHLVIAILHRNGRLPPMPDALKRAGGQYGIEYQGSLARAQRTDEVASIERLASFVAALANLEFVEAREVFDPVAAVREVAARLGCPADTLKSEAVVKKLQADREKASRQMAMAAVAKAQGEAAQQGADAVKSAQEAGASVPASPVPVVAPTFQE